MYPCQNPHILRREHKAEDAYNMSIKKRTKLKKIQIKKKDDEWSEYEAPAVYSVTMVPANTSTHSCGW